MTRYLLGGVLVLALVGAWWWTRGDHAAQRAEDQRVEQAFSDQRKGERDTLKVVTTDQARIRAAAGVERETVAALERRIAAMEADRAKRAAEGAQLVEQASKDGGAQAVVDAYRAAGWQAVVVKVKRQPVQR